MPTFDARSLCFLWKAPMSPTEVTFPSAWRVRPLGEIARYAAGRTPARANPAYWEPSSSGGVPWITIGDMKPYATITGSSERVSDRAIDEAFNHRIVRAGTLLMSFKLSIGRVATLGIDAVHNEAIVALYPSGEVDQKFLEYYLSQVDWSQYQDRAIKGNTLNRNKIDRVSIALPTPDEQRRIATILWKVQRAIEVQERLVATVRELKQAAMRVLFTRGLRGEAQKETEIGAVPESWEVERLGDNVVQAQYGLSIRGAPSGQHPMLRMNCQLDGQTVFRNLQYVDIDARTLAAFKLNRGDLLFNRTNSYELVGRMSLFDSDAVAVFASYLIRLELERTKLDPAFVNYYFNMPSTQAALRALASRGVSQANISASKIREFRLPRPTTLAEQHEIATALQTIDRKLAHHERKRETLQELFKTLLHDLMSGRIRVHELDLDITAPTAGTTGGEDA